MLTVIDSMKKTVQIIRASDDPTVANIPVVIGGSTVDQEVCLYVSANYWANDDGRGQAVLNCLKNSQNNQEFAAGELSILPALC